MNDSLKDILSDRSYSQPEEFEVIKQFVKDKFDEIPELQIQNHTIVIRVRGSALAGSLQLHLYELKQMLPEKTKLRIQSV